MQIGVPRAGGDHLRQALDIQSEGGRAQAHGLTDPVAQAIVERLEDRPRPRRLDQAVGRIPGVGQEAGGEEVAVIIPSIPDPVHAGQAIGRVGQVSQYIFT